MITPNKRGRASALPTVVSIAIAHSLSVPSQERNSCPRKVIRGECREKLRRLEFDPPGELPPAIETEAAGTTRWAHPRLCYINVAAQWKSGKSHRHWGVRRNARWG